MKDHQFPKTGFGGPFFTVMQMYPMLLHKNFFRYIGIILFIFGKYCKIIRNENNRKLRSKNLEKKT